MTEGPTVKAEYSCRSCGLYWRRFEVRERGPQEDVVAWVELVQREMGADHQKASPWCAAKTSDLKIPMPGGPHGRIGAAYRQ